MVKKQICLVITKSNFGGAQKYVYEIATSLDRETFDVTVALGGSGILKTKLEEAGIEVIQIPKLERDISVFKEFSVFGFLYKLFKERKFDVVHLNSSKVSAIAAVASRFLGVPKIIFTAHGWAFNEDRSTPVKFLFKISYWVTIILSDITISVSEKTKLDVIGWPFIANKIKVIRNGVKEIDFYEKEIAKEKINQINHRIQTSKFLIGTIAELHPVKGLETLIESAKEISKEKDVQFVIIGEGQARQELEEKIQFSNLQNNVILLGFLDNAAKYLKAFDLFVLPSKSEALALVILEAGLAKVPIIASRVGGIPEIISDTKYGKLFESGNSEQLTKEITDSIENYEQSKQSAENLNQKIAADFSYRKMLEETISLY